MGMGMGMAARAHLLFWMMGHLSVGPHAWQLAVTFFSGSALFSSGLPPPTQSLPVKMFVLSPEPTWCAK